MANFHMPARGEHAAPTFDRTKPRELVRFFKELEYLFKRAELDDEEEKKEHVLRYVEFEVEQIWKSFPEYADATKKYIDFKAAILVHYPDAAGDYVYSLRDMDLLIGERQRLGIANMLDLADYHLKFLTITTWLIDKEQLGTLEQQRGYLRVFQPRLLGAINNRLQMKYPDQHPNIPYKIQDVYEAARIDGASRWQTFRDVTLPLLKPTLALTTVLCVTGSLLAFEQFYILTKGGPDNSTITVVQLIYSVAFQGPNNLGVAGALSVIVLLALVVINIAQIRAFGRKVED